MSLRRDETPQGGKHEKRLKRRKTFTLSPESIALLEELSAQSGSGERESISAVLDAMLTAIREERRRLDMERSTEEYYGERSSVEEEVRRPGRGSR
jgi:hypothetical protein